jgi:FHS family L-fucose permease-like MFS transporter
VQQIRSLLTAPNYNLGLLAQFCYVGAQVGVGSFFIRYATIHSHIQESVAATALSAGLLLFMTGRFLGTFLMRFIPAAKLLLIYASICIVLCLFVSLNASAAGMWILILLQFFMSIMFPSIFSLSLGQLKQSPPMASSLLIMSIVGGAIFPLAMGFLSDQSSIQYAYLVPALCFVAVAIFAKRISALAISATTL